MRRILPVFVNVEDCAARILELLDSVTMRKQFGEAGREKVRQDFFLPRLVRDKLRLLNELLKS